MYEQMTPNYIPPNPSWHIRDSRNKSRLRKIYSVVVVLYRKCGRRPTKESRSHWNLLIFGLGVRHAGY